MFKKSMSKKFKMIDACLLYTSDAADDLTRVDLGGRRIIKKKINMVDAAVKKIVKCDISAIVSLILIKFAATMHISHCNSNSRSMH